MIDYIVCSPIVPASLRLAPTIPRYHSFNNDSFSFLNIPHSFNAAIDWNCSEHGKLWCYNLTYFDFLNQEGMSRETGLHLIHDFIGRINEIQDGLEPYPISLRIINWIKFIARNEIHDDVIDRFIYAQALMLANNLEYHLLGNHLVENGFALVFAGKYCNDGKLFATAKSILIDELNVQILPDGAHFELSPMYHQIILDRLMDCVNLLQNTGKDATLPLLTDKVAVMIGWLRQMSFRDGSIPLLNDSAEGIAPACPELFSYAKLLGIEERIVPLKESGYRKVSAKRYELIVDVGNIGPDYIPGHAHSDTLSFVLNLNGSPLIVDSGTSTYEANGQRQLERRTAAHNTVMIDGLEQSEMWGSFRVARRAYAVDLLEQDGYISASHTGYDRIGVRHRREFTWDERVIEIIDTINSKKGCNCLAYLHFHPDVQVCLENSMLSVDGARIGFSGASEVKIGDYLYAPKFNVLIPAKLVTVLFVQNLTTSILIV